MAPTYQYKPKLGLDMRIRPPKEGEEEAAKELAKPVADASRTHDEAEEEEEGAVEAMDVS